MPAASGQDAALFTSHLFEVQTEHAHPAHRTLRGSVNMVKGQVISSNIYIKDSRIVN